MGGLQALLWGSLWCRLTLAANVWQRNLCCMVSMCEACAVRAMGEAGRSVLQNGSGRQVLLDIAEDRSCRLCSLDSQKEVASYQSCTGCERWLWHVWRPSRAVSQGQNIAGKALYLPL